MRLLVEEGHQPAQAQPQRFETVQVEPLPEAALLHGGQVFELGLDGGDRRLLLQQHGDFDHPLPVTLDGAHVALGQG